MSFLCEGEPPPPVSTPWGAYRPLTINAGTHFTYPTEGWRAESTPSQVELGVDIEPGTSQMTVHCSTNWAISADSLRNIAQVPTIDLYDVGRSYKVDNLRFATFIARYIKSKEHLISEAMEEVKINALVITETWLKDNKEDDQWMKSFWAQHKWISNTHHQ